MIILLGITIGAIFSEDGIIGSAIKAAFVEEMSQIKEQIQIKEHQDASRRQSKDTIQETWQKVKLEETKEWDIDLKKEIIYWGKYKVGISEITKEYAKENADAILEEVNEEGIIPNLYYVEKEIAQGKERSIHIRCKRKSIIQNRKNKDNMEDST